MTFLADGGGRAVVSFDFSPNPNDKTEVKFNKIQETTESKNLDLFFQLNRKWLGNPPKTERFSLLNKIPFFILFMSGLEVIVYYMADDKLKRVLLYDTENKMEIWRFLSYMLLHTDSLHLGLNVVIQGLLGAPLEFEQGRLRSAAIYFGGGLAGSIGASAFLAFSLMAGASGGVYALLTSQIPNAVLNYKTMKYAAYRIVIVMVLAASDVIYIFFHVYLYNNEKPQIGWAAHASGAAAGILLGFLFFNGTSKWKKKFQITSGLLLALLLFGAVLPHLKSFSVIL